MPYAVTQHYGYCGVNRTGFETVKLARAYAAEVRRGGRGMFGVSIWRYADLDNGFLPLQEKTLVKYLHPRAWQ